MINIIFMGSDEFSSIILAQLIKKKYNIKLVIIKNNNKINKKKKNLVKILSIKNNIKFIQINKKLFFLKLKEFNINCDFIITASFGYILSDNILKIPKICSINVHPSLLPKYRGSSPIYSAIINGDIKTGITIIQMNTKIDSGDILLQKSLLIYNNDTNYSLSCKLSYLGAKMLIKVIEKLILKKRIFKKKQDKKKVIFTSKIDIFKRKINWFNTSFEIERKVRALYPEPSAFTYYKKKILKLLKVEIIYKKINNIKNVGIIIKTKKNLYVICGNKTILKIIMLQIEGKKSMYINDFLNGMGKNIKNLDYFY